MYALMVQHFCMTHLLILLSILSLIINTVTPQQTLVQSAQLSPSNTRDNGAYILSNLNEVTTINNQWTAKPVSQSSWQFIIMIDNTFGFDEFAESSITITANTISALSPQPPAAPQPAPELLFAFTSTNREYVASKIAMDNNPSNANQVYPACDQSPASTQLFAAGDIASLPALNRPCDIAGGSCANWQNMQPQNGHFPASQAAAVQPLTFTLQQKPATNAFSFYYEHKHNFLQTCHFGTSLPANNGIKLYMAANYAYNISSFTITSALKERTDTPTQSPTASPTTIPPTNSPVVPPTNYPSVPPTTKPSDSPSESPSKSPTYHPTFPTFAPTTFPTQSPTTSLPTVFPTKNPTVTAPAPPGYAWGAYKQLCAVSQKQACVTGGTLLDAYGSVLCVEGYECCKCGSIECGVRSQYPCYEFRAGPAGVYGVKDIRIAGDKSSANGVSIECSGVNACKDAVITASDVDYIDCDGPSACQLAVISVTDPKESFMIDCAGVSACEGLTIDVTLSAPPAGFACRAVAVKELFEFGKILCTDENACHGLHITINNEGCDRVVIQELECIVPNACDAAVFNFIGDIGIETCQCGPSCDNAIGLDQCFENLDTVMCSEPYVCQGSSKTITNPADGFEFVCSNVQSCENANFLIKLDRGLSNMEPVTHLAGFFMGGMYSARGATFTIENTSGSDVVIDLIDCGGEGACYGATFITGNVMINEVNCANGACWNCVIKQTINGPAIPCDSKQT